MDSEFETPMTPEEKGQPSGKGVRPLSRLIGWFGGDESDDSEK